MLCARTTARGTPCKRHAVEGSTECASHLGTAHAPTLLTQELADQIVASLRAGNYITVATKAAGVNRITFNGWMAKGRSGKASDAQYRELRTRVESARAEAETRAVAQIARAAANNWQAAAWLLERTAPERWGKPSVRLRDEPTRPAEQPITTTPDPFAEVDELATARRKRGA